MASYFDATKNVVVTEERLVQLGYPTSDTLLRKANIYPIDYKYPSYNSDTQRIEPDGKPIKDISCLYYNQHFTVVDLTDEEKAAIQKTRSEAAAKSRLIEIDAETSRPLRAWINNSATEYDLKKLYELECNAKKERAVLAGKAEPVCPPYTPGVIPSGPAQAISPITTATKYMELTEAQMLPIDVAFLELLYLNTPADVYQTLPNGLNIQDGMEILVSNTSSFNVILLPSTPSQSVMGSRDYTVTENSRILLKWIREDNTWTKVLDNAPTPAPAAASQLE